MPPRRTKVQGTKEASEDAKPRPAAPVVGGEKPPKTAEGGSAWGRPREAAPARAQAAPAPAAPASPTAAPKAKAPSKIPTNIAAQAARNLGGFVPNKIFVGGVPITCTEEQFRSYFEPFGAISKVELHALRGFGYITYESVEAVDACLERYEEHYLCKKWVEVKRSIPRELIDAYDREQRRLHAELLGVEGGGDRAGAHAEGKPEPAAPSPAGPAATGPPAPWAHAHPPLQGPARRSGGHALAGRGAEPGGAAGLSRIAQLREMGFSDAVARSVLAECAWDVNEAIDRLLLSGAMADGGGNDGPPAGGGEGPAAAPPASEPPATASTAEPAAAAAPGSPSAGGAAPGGLAGAAGSAAAAEAAATAPPEAATTAQAPEAVAAAAAAESGAVTTAAEAAEPAEAAQPVEAAAEAAPAVATPAVPAEAVPLPPATIEPAAEPAAAPLSAVASTGAEAGAEPDGAQGGAQEAEAAAVTEAPVAAAAAPPRKRIEQVMRSWNAEDTSQMSVCEGDFVHVWIDTGTDNGWIHAEGQGGSASQIGWLPLCVLKRLPEGQQWMRVGQQWQALDDSQCSVQAGITVVVWSGTRTKEGWVHVEAEKDGVMKPGWLPVFCLEWGED